MIATVIIVALVAVVLVAALVAAPRMSGRPRAGQNRRSHRRPIVGEPAVATDPLGGHPHADEVEVIHQQVEAPVAGDPGPTAHRRFSLDGPAAADDFAWQQGHEARVPVLAEAGYPVADAGYPVGVAGHGYPIDGSSHSLYGRSRAEMPVGNSAADELLEVVAQLRAERAAFASPAAPPAGDRFVS